MGQISVTKRAFVGLLTIAALSGACGDSKDTKSDDASDATTTTIAVVKTEDVMLTAADNNSTQNLKVGQKLVVALDVNGGTGYSWPVTTEPDATVLKLVSQDQAKKDTGSDDGPMTGTPETVTTTFEAVSAGTTKVVLSFVGPGAGRKAEDTFTVTVTVA